MRNHTSRLDNHPEHPLIGRGKTSPPGRGVQWEDGFFCKQCRIFVTSSPIASGVQNRNHCPCCLWSRHLDLFQPGDRLSACKSLMKPIGLTLKRTRNKYGSDAGELMLVHRCQACSSISINRCAADDVPQNIVRVLKGSACLGDSLLDELKMLGILLLQSSDTLLVYSRLYGSEQEMDVRRIA